MSSSIGNSNGSASSGNYQNADVKVLGWMENLIQEDNSTAVEDQLIGPQVEEESASSPRYLSSYLYPSTETTHLLGKRLPKGASQAYIFSCAALYINIPISVICNELSRCHFRTTPDAVRHLLVHEIDRADPSADVPTSLFPPDAYTIRALVTFLIRLNVPAQAIWQNVMDWSGGLPISGGGVSRVREKRNIFERMNRFLMETPPPDRAAANNKLGFFFFLQLSAYINNALDLGLSPAQMIHYLTEAFPQASTWMTKEYVYDVIILVKKNNFSLKKITTGRRRWDRAGEEFARIATNVVGLSDERMYCCLLMAGYDIECDLELAEYFLARKNQVPSPPPPPAAATDTPAAEKEKEKEEEVGDDEKEAMTKAGVGKSLILLRRKKGPRPFVGHNKKKAEEKPDSYW